MASRENFPPTITTTIEFIFTANRNRLGLAELMHGIHDSFGDRNYEERSESADGREK